MFANVSVLYDCSLGAIQGEYSSILCVSILSLKALVICLLLVSYLVKVK